MQNTPLNIKNEDFWKRFPNCSATDLYTCRTCGQPLYVTLGDMEHYIFAHQRWHECQPDHIPDPISGWPGEDNEYMRSWREELICWILERS